MELIVTRDGGLKLGKVALLGGFRRSDFREVVVGIFRFLRLSRDVVLVSNGYLTVLRVGDGCGWGRGRFCLAGGTYRFLIVFRVESEKMSGVLVVLGVTGRVRFLDENGVHWFWSVLLRNVECGNLGTSGFHLRLYTVPGAVIDLRLAV